MLGLESLLSLSQTVKHILVVDVLFLDLQLAQEDGLLSLELLSGCVNQLLFLFVETCEVGRVLGGLDGGGELSLCLEDLVFSINDSLFKCAKVLQVLCPGSPLLFIDNLLSLIENLLLSPLVSQLEHMDLHLQLNLETLLSSEFEEAHALFLTKFTLR